MLHQALVATCALDPGGTGNLRAIDPQSRITRYQILERGGQLFRQSLTLVISEDRHIRITRLSPGGRLRRVTVELWAGTEGGDRPLISLQANESCVPRERRRLSYDNAGRARVLLIEDPTTGETLSTEPLNPPVPTLSPAKPFEGPVIAVVDTGVTYTLPEISTRLARDADGRLMGFDYWDQDDRPFDLDTSRSPFFPLRHGTAVSSILLREAPDARLAPYRFPRPEMARFKDMIEEIAGHNIRIVNLAMGSRKSSDWAAFEAAASVHPDILFIVSAGNDGRDIDQSPIYPAALPLENILVVTSSDAFGKLASGSNFGRYAVDIMVPGEQVDVMDHRGVRTKASGSSFAVPRVTALAARLLGKHPDWRAPELKAAIMKRARKGFGPPPPVKAGWIPDPLDDFEG